MQKIRCKTNGPSKTFPVTRIARQWLVERQCNGDATFTVVQAESQTNSQNLAQ